MIRVEGLRKTFGKVTAVEQVDFDAHDGKVTALLGPNGAGKSTTLRMIAATLSPDSGHVEIDGKKVESQSSLTAGSLGVLPFGVGLYPRLSGRENIRYFGQLQGLAGDALEEKIDRLVEDLGLAKVADRAAKGYSQGERMKVAVARVLVCNPKNVILDEPTNGLDVYALRALRRLIRELAESGRTVLFSSHVMQEVAALCDRIVIIAQGRVVADGSADVLREAFAEKDLEEVFIKAIGGEA